jgi:hypothetical protein
MKRNANFDADVALEGAGAAGAGADLGDAPAAPRERIEALGAAREAVPKWWACSWSPAAATSCGTWRCPTVPKVADVNSSVVHEHIRRPVLGRSHRDDPVAARVI